MLLPCHELIVWPSSPELKQPPIAVARIPPTAQRNVCLIMIAVPRARTQQKLDLKTPSISVIRVDIHVTSVTVLDFVNPDHGRFGTIDAIRGCVGRRSAPPLSSPVKVG